MRIWLHVLGTSAVLGLAGAAFAAAPAFETLDDDKDGRLSRSEAAEVEELDFAKADRNQDGTLDRSEYEAAIS